MNNMFKKLTITGLTAVMVLGGSASAFADGKGKGNDKNDWRFDGKQSIIKSQNNNNGKNSSNSGNTYIQNGNNNIQIILDFGDVKGGDVEWAAKSIASLASKKVFEGYEDGTFQPRKDITRIEAITAAVRLMGLRDKAESAEEQATKLNFKDASKIPSWAVGYVAVAAENDLFLETDSSVQPDKAADRLWATTLLVKALKLTDEAKAKMNTKLTFKDADKIPAGAVGYVAVAVEKGLINGYEDNTFRPERSVSRAELAALLDRTGDQMSDASAITGTVNAVLTNNVLSITRNSQSVSVTLDPNAFVYRNGSRIAASDLKVGETVKIRSYNGIAIFIEVTTGTTPTTPTTPTTNAFTVDGTFNSFTWNASNQITGISVTQTVYVGTTPTQQTTLYPVASNVAILGNPVNFVAGHAVQLKGTETSGARTVTSIEIK